MACFFKSQRKIVNSQTKIKAMICRHSNNSRHKCLLQLYVKIMLFGIADIPLMTANFLNFRNFRHKWANNGNSWHFLALLGAFLSIPFLITNPPPFQVFFIKCPPSLLITPYPAPKHPSPITSPRPTPRSLLIEMRE